MADQTVRLGDALPVSDVQLAWITASQDQRMAITVDNVRAIDSAAWDHMEDVEIQTFVTQCWNTAQKLRITDRLSFAYFCYYSLCWGMYFYLDPRWGHNKKLMEAIEIPAQIRLEKVFAQITPIEQACYGPHHVRLRELATHYSSMDLAHSLPHEIGDMVRLLKAVFQRQWPERLEHLPPHYFENTVIYMKQQCTRLGLYGEWDLLLTSALALIDGRYFFYDPAFSWLAKAFLVKDNLTGRDKAVKILRIAQAVVKKSMTRAT